MPARNAPRDITRLVLKAVALAMGIAVVVISLLGTGTLGGSVLLLGIGLAALALESLM